MKIVHAGMFFVFLLAVLAGAENAWIGCLFALSMLYLEERKL